jgi:hypothetical protein
MPGLASASKITTAGRLRMGLRDTLSKGADAARTQMEERREARADEQATREAHLTATPKCEYQVKRIGEDKQRGLLGSGRMEEIPNGEGRKGWELVCIEAERATFKRRLG